VWTYTPRQITAFLHFASKRKRQEMATQIRAIQVAQHGKPKDVDKLIKELTK